MTQKRVRWTCPNGCPGILSSTRPPKDSVDRYCLACSAKTGRLVLRIAPALETRRAAAATTAAAKAKAKRAREAAKKAKAKQAEIDRYTVEGVDLRDEMTSLLRLKAWNGHFGRPGLDGGFHNRPELVISKRSRVPLSRMGYAEPWINRITVATYPGQTLADARETLVHELVHLVVGPETSKTAWHGPTFKATMLAAFKEAYKVAPAGIPHNVYHGRYAAALKKKEEGSQ